MLPRRRLILWWLAAMVLWSTVVWSVQELPNDQMMLSPEKQRLEPGFDEDPSGEETRLLEKLQARFKELEEREHTLQQREERVAALQRDLEALAARQTKDKQQLEEQASSLAAEQRRYIEQDPALIHLIKIYESMDPEEAALRLTHMRDDLALDILAGIKDKKAAGVLAGVEPKKAATLSEGLRQYRDRKLQQHQHAQSTK